MLKFCLREYEYKRKTASIKRSRQLSEGRYSNHLEMTERFDDPAFPLCFRNIQVCHMKSVLLLHPILNLLVSSLAFRCRHIHLTHINLHADMILRLRKFGQKTYRLDMARLLQIDVKSPPDWAVRSREYIKDFFDLKIAIFRPRSYAETGRCGCPYL